MDSRALQGYRLDTESGVWARPEYSGIEYSDGDEVEGRLLSIVESAQDITVLSSELPRYLIDWPSVYHLSGARANILRPFEPSLQGDILEIGAGCGAISRYLGECGARILALEGSYRRARIVRSRTRDLDNVTVVCDSFESFSIEKKFDAITLIGVLEYSNLFMSGDQPVLAMLRQVGKLLKPGGRLFIAIENQLGLKYFAGAPEDHMGIAMYGIEGRYGPKEPVTFGRLELDGLLRDAGFQVREFLAPFPDYKLPVSIVTELGFGERNFDVAALIRGSVRRDPQLPSIAAFALDRAWPIVCRNGIGLDLSNSFLIAAGVDSTMPLLSSELAWHFSTGRRKEFCKVTTFSLHREDKIRVSRKAVGNGARQFTQIGRLDFQIEPDDNYSKGKQLSIKFGHAFSRDGWSVQEICLLLRQYLRLLATFSSATPQGDNLNMGSMLPGDLFDCIPQNILISDNGEARFIDREWGSVEPVQTGFMVFRSLLSILANISMVGASSDALPRTYEGVILGVMRGLGWKVIESTLREYAELETEFQNDVLGCDARHSTVVKLLSSTIATDENLSLAVANRGFRITEIEGKLHAVDEMLVSANDRLREVCGSKSWRLTAPFRCIGRGARRLLKG